MIATNHEGMNTPIPETVEALVVHTGDKAVA